MFDRFISARIQQARADTPVILLAGPRQVGKSTLARAAARTPVDRPIALTGERESSSLPANYFTLDDANTLAAVQADAQGFLESQRGAGMVVIDEVQRVPELLVAIKREVDIDRRPGRFLLTGSANVLTMPKVAESLAGRMEPLTMWPLSQSEIEGNRSRFLRSAFSPDAPSWVNGHPREHLVARAMRGGFPEAVARASAERRAAWFGSYVTAIVQREIKSISAIEDEGAMTRVLRTIASRSGGPKNVQSLAADTGIPNTTIQRYIALLQMTFLVAELPAWFRNRDARLVKAPKLLVTDSGLYGNLLGMNAADPRIGFLWETFVGAELLRLVSFEAEAFALMHFRTQKQHEVDFVLEDRAGRVVGIEVKMARTVNSADFAGLRALQTASGEAFHRGLLLYSGERTLPFGSGMWAAPVSALWSSA